MRSIDITIGDMHVRQGFTRHIDLIPEDSNIPFFKNEDELRKELVRRARCVLGFRGGSRKPEGMLNGNAVQHALRDIVGGFRGTFNVDEHIVARHAVHIANETEYGAYYPEECMNDVA